MQIKQHCASRDFFSYTDFGAGYLGINSLYLATELTGIIDEKQPVEDCTTRPLRKERKNTLNDGMGGM